MHCDEVRELLEELETREPTASVREHLASCAECRTYARDWRLARASFRALAAEPAPEPTLGFAARLVRRLDETAERRRAGAEFLERAGRRFVYATLCLTLMILLALLLPDSGPLRGPTTADLYMAQTDVVPAGSDPVFAGAFSESPSPPPANSTSGSETRH